MMNKKSFFLILILILVVINTNSVFSVGFARLSHSGIPTYDFEPNLEIRVDYAVAFADDDTYVEVSGDLEEFVTVSRTKIPYEDKDKRFSVYVNLPESYEGLSPGTNRIRLRIYDKHKTEGMFQLKTEAGTFININIPYPGYFAEFSEFELGNVNAGEDGELNFVVWNRGKEDFNDGRFEFNIFDDSERTLLSESRHSIFIASEEKKSFSIPLRSSNLNPGYYKAILNFGYSNRSIEKTSDFNVGTLNVDIINYTQVLEQDAIQKFDITIQSDWNALIRNVFASISIPGIDTVRTSPADLSNFEIMNINTFIDTYGLEIGKHEAQISLHYEDEISVKDVTIEVIEQIKDKPDEIRSVDFTTILIIIVIILLLTLIVFAIIYFKKEKLLNKKTNENENKE